MKTLYISQHISSINPDIVHFEYWKIFRGKLYSVESVNARLMSNEIKNDDEIYMFYDNGKMKRLGKLGDYNVRPLAEFYRGLGYNV
jgi:hypothetical protein